MKKYRVIYADPPWRFNNFSVKGEGRNAVSHYDCLTLPDLKKLNINRHADKDCALLCGLQIPCLIKATYFLIKTFALNYQ